MGDHPDLEAVRRFWRTLFEEQEIARRIAALAEETSANTAIVCNISQYGEVRLKVHSTSSLGDNFMSDAYVISAHVVDGVIEYSSFIKVSRDILFMNLCFLKGSYRRYFPLTP